MNEQIAVRFEMLQTRALLGHGKTGMVLTKDMLQAVCNLCYANKLIFLSLKHNEEDESDVLFLANIWDMDTMDRHDSGMRSSGGPMCYAFGKNTLDLMEQEPLPDHGGQICKVKTYGNQTIPRVQTHKEDGDIANIFVFNDDTEVLWQGINDPPADDLFSCHTGPKGLFYSIVGDYEIEEDQKYKNL